MTIQLSSTVRNARLNAITTAIGASAKLIIYSGSAPASCAEAPAGTVLATLNLPAAWMSDAASGVKPMAGTWSDLSADETGTAGYFRIYDNSEIACGMQGTITASGGGGDMTIDNTSIVQGQSVEILSFVLTDGNA
jgi:hypothetical protein